MLFENVAFFPSKSNLAIFFHMPFSLREGTNLLWLAVKHFYLSEEKLTWNELIIKNSMGCRK